MPMLISFQTLILILVASFWLEAVTFVCLQSGWLALMKRYPDWQEAPTLTLKHQSGVMGWGVYMAGILTLSVCPSGLQIKIWRILGWFCKPIFVPWQDVRFIEKKGFFRHVVKFQFGMPERGSLTVSRQVARELAKVSQGRLPEFGVK
jgi:hypothetical protein